MTTKEQPTVEMTLAVLSEAVGKAADDLCAVRPTLDAARADIASRIRPAPLRTHSHGGLSS